MRKIEVHDVKTGPLRDSRDKLRPQHGPYLVDAKRQGTMRRIGVIWRVGWLNGRADAPPTPEIQRR
jgi:hypothetical protein